MQLLFCNAIDQTSVDKLFRRSYLAVSITVDKLFYKHGRFDVNHPYKHGSEDSMPVGRSWLQVQCEERWGAIVLPNLHAIMTMILGVVDKEGISEVMLWAKDLKGAFTLLRFHSSQS